MRKNTKTLLSIYTHIDRTQHHGLNTHLDLAAPTKILFTAATDPQPHQAPLSVQFTLANLDFHLSKIALNSTCSLVLNLACAS